MMELRRRVFAEVPDRYPAIEVGKTVIVIPLRMIVEMNQALPYVPSPAPGKVSH